MTNICLIFITVIGGLFLLFIFRNKSDFLKIFLIILTFSIARIFFGLEWKFITGNINIINLTTKFFRLLLANFILLSIIFIFGVNHLTKQKFSSLGWAKNKILKNIFIGLVIGAIFFILLTFNKSIKFGNLVPAIFFSFFIASWQEENIFRGHLIKYFSHKFSSQEILIYQALIYSLSHLGFYSFFSVINLILSLIFAFILGLIFGYLRMKIKSQIPAFLTHGIIDMGFLIV